MLCVHGRQAGILTLRIHVCMYSYIPPGWAPTLARIHVPSRLINYTILPSIPPPPASLSPISPPILISSSPHLCVRDLERSGSRKWPPPSPVERYRSYREPIGRHSRRRVTCMVSRVTLGTRNAPPTSTPPPDITAIDWVQSSQIWIPNFLTRTAPS